MKLLSVLFLYLLNLLCFAPLASRAGNFIAAASLSFNSSPVKQITTSQNSFFKISTPSLHTNSVKEITTPTTSNNTFFEKSARKSTASSLTSSTSGNFLSAASTTTSNNTFIEKPATQQSTLTPTNSAKQPTLVNVQRYGAKGDGKTDDYNAILAAVKVINTQGGGELYFPKGRYYIQPYHTKDNEVQDIVIQQVKNLTVRGEQAVIEVNGAFYRDVDYYAGRNKKQSYSKTSSVIPFVFKNCEGLTISGLEIKGQVDQMTRAKNLTELGGHLMTFNNCSNVKVSDVYVHHAQTDGIYINNKSSDFTFTKVRSSNNARQGMSIIELVNGHFEDCLFSETGFTGGKYGGHAPKAGVDIEPHAGKQKVENITFYKCSFIGNGGPQFVCSKPLTTSGITLDNCIFAAGKGTYAYQLILTAKNLVVKNSSIDLGKGSIYPVWPRYSGSDVQILNCTIQGSGRGIVAVSKDPANKVLLQNNQLTFTGETLNSYFPYLQMNNLRFIDNKVNIPAKSIRKGKITSLVQKVELSSGNVFKSGHPQVRPKVSYEGSKKVRDH